MKIYQVANHWCLLSYYTTCPEAPDGSGRVLMAAADLEKKVGHVAILDADGKLVDMFGQVPLDRTFWHTGLWQSWSPDARYVYYQSGESYERSAVTRRELRTGKEVRLEGADMEGGLRATRRPPPGYWACFMQRAMVIRIFIRSARRCPLRIGRITDCLRMILTRVPRALR